MLSIGNIFRCIAGQNFLAAEVSLGVLAATAVPKDSVLVLVLAWAQYTAGATTTQMNLFIRRGSGTSGPVIAQGFTTVVAGNNVSMSVLGIDTLILGATAQYTMTGFGTGATGNCTLTDGLITALFLA